VMHIPILRKLRILQFAFLVLAVTVIPASAATPAVSLINPGGQYGFGDKQNSYSWGMAWFKGKLYVSTARNVLCVEGATANYYFPGQGYYKTSPDPSVTCPADEYDLDLRAEIWAYDPTNTAQPWTRVYQSPTVANPAESGKTIARDIAYRDMSVVTINGVQTLVVAGVTAGEYIHNADFTPSLPAPRLLLSTDGLTFAEAPFSGPVSANWVTGPNSTPQIPNPYPMGFRAIQQLPDGRIFVTATVSLTGDGVVAQFNPATKAFTQVGPPTLRAYEMQVFNNQLYVGTADANGYGVYRTNGSTTDANGYFSYTPIVTGGAGRGSSMLSVVSMHVFQGRVYVGASGWFNGASTELIRISPDDSWDVVVGAPRTYNGVAKNPISGYIDGFDNFFNVHFWRMEDINGVLFVGTNDSSWLFRTIPWLDSLLSWQYGYDMYASCDGQFWSPVTINAFGNDSTYNFGARTLATDGAGDGYVGSANHAEGTGVWQGTGVSGCGQPTAAASLTSGNPVSFGLLAPATQGQTPPGRLEAQLQACGTALSWDPTLNAKQYRISRATDWQTQTAIPRPNAPQIPHGTSTLTLGSLFGPTAIPAQTWIAGPLQQIATTTQPGYLDRTASPGGHYTYQVQAVAGNGAVSPASNLAPVPSNAPTTSYGQLATAITTLIGKGKVGALVAPAILGALTQAQTAAAHGDAAGTLTALNALNALVFNAKGHTVDTLAAQDVAAAVANLTRQVGFAQVGCGQG
jgi:hypothetical protein